MSLEENEKKRVKNEPERTFDKENFETISINTPTDKIKEESSESSINIDKSDDQLDTIMIVPQSNDPKKNSKNEKILNHSDTDRYNSRKHLGQGGMKKIELVKDDEMKRVVAKASIHDENMNSENIKSFIYEARLTAALQHPNILQIYDIGENEKGEPFFIMEHLDGVTLHEVLKTISQGDKSVRESFSIDQLIDIFEKVCLAIEYAHQHSTYHLDLKPDNILISNDANVHVIDWGLAIIKSDETDHSHSINDFMKSKEISDSLTGKIRGTPGYLAPEQIIGKIKFIKPQTDIYGLGGLLYSILCFEIPVSGENPIDRISETLHADVIPPSKRRPDLNIDHQLEKICMKALEHRICDRYSHVRQLLADIRKYKRRPYRMMVLKCASVFLILCFAFTIYLFFNSRLVDADGNWVGKKPQTLFELHESLVHCNPQYKHSLNHVFSDTKLEEVKLNDSHISNLTPLKGLSIKKLDLSGSTVNELASIHSLPIEHLNLYNTDIVDLSLLKHMPLQSIQLPPIEKLKKGWIDILKNISSLKIIATTQNELNEKQSPEVFFNKLARGDYIIWTDRKYIDSNKNWIGPPPKLHNQMNAALRLSNSNIAVIHEFFTDKNKELTYLHLHGVDNISALKNIKTLQRIVIHGTNLKDISPLTGLQINYLDLNNTHVTEYSNLKTMNLSSLNLSSNDVTNISFLKGINLTELKLASCRIQDITPLKGMKLKFLSILDTHVQDISALKGMPLQKLLMPHPKQLTEDTEEVLLSLNKLEEVTFKEGTTIIKLKPSELLKNYKNGKYK